MSSADGRPASEVEHQSQRSSSDPLAVELTERLPDLVAAVLQDPQVAHEVASLHVDPAMLSELVLAERDDLLRQTNREIAELREARRLRDAHAEKTDTLPGESAIDGRLSTAIVTGLAAAAFAPVATWEAWNSLPAGWFWGIVGIFVGALLFASIVYIGLAAGRRMATLWGDRSGASEGSPAGRERYNKDLAGDVCALGIGAWVTSGLVMLARRTIPPLYVHGGIATTLAVWIPVGLLGAIATMGVIFGGTAPGRPASESSEGARPKASRGILRVRSVSFAMVAVAVTGAAALVVSSLPMRLPRPVTRLELLDVATLALPFVLLTLVMVTAPARRRLARLRHRDRINLRTRQVDRAQSDWEAAIRFGPIREAIRRKSAELRNPVFSPTLNVIDAAGLHIMNDRNRTIFTPGFADFGTAVHQVRGGAVGVAGTRGVGKSTLLAYYRDGLLLPPGTEHIGLYERIPVRYDAREFALHLYAAVCESVIGFLEPRHAAMPQLSTRARRLTLSPRLRRSALSVSAGLWIGLAVWSAILGSAQHLRAHAGWLVALAAAAVVATLAGTLAPTARGRVLQSEPVGIVDSWTLLRSARQRLREIRFEQRYSTGWSGKLTGFGAEVARDAAVESSARSMTYPDVVRQFHTFIADAVAVLQRLPNISAVPVVIILDEMDKIAEPQQAQEFLNEIKSLFSTDSPGCVFLISVSEDALSSFERRGLPVRDAFDSAFDMIFELRELTLAEARNVLLGRAIGLSAPFVELAYCLAGGLSRDLLRIARSMVRRNGQQVSEVAAALMEEDVRQQLRAFALAAANCTTDEPYTSRLIQLLKRQRSADPAQLISTVTSPVVPAEWTGPIAQVHLDALTYLYYAATVREIFTDDLTERAIIDSRSAGPEVSIEALAAIRSTFAVNTRLAWLELNTFRTYWRLEIADPPNDQGGRHAPVQRDSIVG